MKTTLLSQDGLLQIVLTPETQFEKEVVDKYGKNALTAKIFHGNFEECQGGWTHRYSEKSLMIVCKEGEM